MAYVAPSTVTASTSPITAAGQNILVNNDIALQASIVRLGLQTKSATNYDITASVVTSATDVFASDITWTADGTSTYIVEFYCPVIFTGNVTGARCQTHLVNAAGASLVMLSEIGQGNTTNSTRAVAPTFARYYYLPSAGSTSINVRVIFVTSASGSAALQLDGGQAPAYLAVFGPNLT